VPRTPAAPPHLHLQQQQQQQQQQQHTPAAPPHPHLQQQQQQIRAGGWNAPSSGPPAMGSASPVSAGAPRVQWAGEWDALVGGHGYHPASSQLPGSSSGGPASVPASQAPQGGEGSERRWDSRMAASVLAQAAAGSSASATPTVKPLSTLGSPACHPHVSSSQPRGPCASASSPLPVPVPFYHPSAWPRGVCLLQVGVCVCVFMRAYVCVYAPVCVHLANAYAYATTHALVSGMCTS
jgi:hypothetical protein